MRLDRRVLMTTDALGGVWSYATELAAALVEQGWATTLAVLGPPPTDALAAEAIAVPGCRLVVTGLPLDWQWSDRHEVEQAGDAVARLAVDEGVTLVQLNQTFLAASATFAQPVVVVVHSCVSTWWAAVHGGTLPQRLGWQSELARRGLQRADRIVAPSRAFAEAVHRVHATPGAPEVVHNGRSRSTLAAEPAAPFAFTAGRLWDGGKNLAVLDRVAARTRLRVLAAGELLGPEGVKPPPRHLETLGALDGAAVQAWLAKRPVYVSPALYEPFGLAVLEAALAGCPLVLADIPTFRELWDGAAVFVAPDDEDGFVRALDALGDDAEAREALGGRAAARAERYTPAAMASGMAGLYARLLGGDARMRQVA